MNASQEAAAWSAYEDDRDWFGAMGGYDGEPAEPIDPETEALDLALCQAAAETYRAQKLALCMAAQRRAAARN